MASRPGEKLIFSKWGEESEDEKEKMEWGADEWGEESEVEEVGSKWGEEGQELVKAEEPPPEYLGQHVVPDVGQHVGEPGDGPYRCHHCLPVVKAYRLKSL